MAALLDGRLTQSEHPVRLLSESERTDNTLDSGFSASLGNPSPSVLGSVLGPGRSVGADGADGAEDGEEDPPAVTPADSLATVPPANPPDAPPTPPPNAPPMTLAQKFAIESSALAALDVRSSRASRRSGYSRKSRRVRRGDVVRPVSDDGSANDGETGREEADERAGNGSPTPIDHDDDRSEARSALEEAISNSEAVLKNSVHGGSEAGSRTSPRSPRGSASDSCDGDPVSLPSSSVPPTLLSSSEAILKSVHVRGRGGGEGMSASASSDDGSPNSVLRLVDPVRIDYVGVAGTDKDDGGKDDGGEDDVDGGYDYSKALVLHSSAKLDDSTANSSRRGLKPSDSERRFVLPPVLSPPPHSLPPACAEGCEGVEHRFVLGDLAPPLAPRSGDRAGDRADDGGVLVDAREAPTHTRRPSREYRGRGERGLDPSERIKDRAILRLGTTPDPPGERSSNVPVVCSDVVPYYRGGGGGGGLDESGDFSDSYATRPGNGAGGNGGIGGSGRRVRWVDPKGLQDEGDIDRDVLRNYEEFSPTSGDPPSDCHPPSNFGAPSTTELFRNPRTRIATVSSGYKKANFFVREDLDTRIYFHTLEDAVGYMARRGYCKMRGEEEMEWKRLLDKAHGVVKKGNKKEKQRYRKGRLIMVLKKTVWDHGDPDDRKKSRRSSNRRKSKQLLLLENGPSSSSQRSTSSQTTDSHTTTLGSDRTSLGRSIRGKYKSYSEKFLAEQEEEKRRYLRAIVEGRPLPDPRSGDDGRPLLLADGPTDAPGEGRSEASGGMRDTSEHSGLSDATDYTDGTGKDSEAFRKSSKSMGSNRKGVYGGGVRYFTPDPVHDSEYSEEGTTEDEDFEEEETYDEEDTYDEEEEGGSHDEEVIDYDGSDVGSMFSGDDDVIDYNGNAGVESVDGSKGSAGPTSSRRGGASTKGRRGANGRSRAPEISPISDDSTYSADSS